MSILCATRFSEESSHAVNAAAALARAHGEPLELIHVAPSGLIRSFGDRFNEVARSGVKAEASRLKTAFGMSVSRDEYLEMVKAEENTSVERMKDVVTVFDTIPIGTPVLITQEPLAKQPPL